jgi:hypothetical protein
MRSHVVLVGALAGMLASAPAAWAQAFVTADSITPASGSGLEQTFVLHYTDSIGVGDLGAWVWFHDATAAPTAPSCLLAYTVASATLNLLDDNRTTWTQSTPGTLTMIENSQCRVILLESEAAAEGTTLTLTLSMQFKTAWLGQKAVDMFAGSASGPNSGWGTRGSLDVSCVFRLSNAVSLMPAAGGDSGTVVFGGDCAWSVSGGAPWITSSLVPTGVTIAVAANAAAAPRRALFTIAGQPFWVIQRGTAPPVRGDFDGDGNVDLLWESPTGDLGLWLMNGASVDLTLDLNFRLGPFSVVGEADFDHDGLLDFLVQAPPGQLTADTLRRPIAQIGPAGHLTQPTDWKVAATGDLNHDGWTDIVWQSPDGAVGVWLMNGTAVVGTQSIYSGSSVWRVVAVDDFDRDGNSGLVWQSPAGADVIWHLDAAAALLSAETVFTGTTDWKIVSTGDIDHDGWPDLIWQTPTGAVAVSYMQGTVIRSTQTIYAGPTAWRIVGPK